MQNRSDKELVAVLLPVYKECKGEVKRAIDSIYRQSYPNLKLLIILDDPNNSETNSFVESYSASLNIDCLLIKNEANLGLVGSLNRALKSCRDADYICRLDADDYSYPKRIEEQLNYLHNNGLDLIGSQMRVVSADGDPLYFEKRYPCTGGKTKVVAAYRSPVPHPTWFGKADVFRDGYRPIPLSEDYDFIIRALLRGFKIGNSPDILLDYQYNLSGISRNNQYEQMIYTLVLQDMYRSGAVWSVNSIIKKAQDLSVPCEKDLYLKGCSCLNGFIKNKSFFDFRGLLRSLFVSSLFRKKILNVLISMGVFYAPNFLFKDN